MNKNTSHLSLASSLLIFKQSIIQHIGWMGLANEAYNLIINNMPITTKDDMINRMLPLLYQPHYIPILVSISLAQWNNYWQYIKKKPHPTQAFTLDTTRPRYYPSLYPILRMN